MKTYALASLLVAASLSTAAAQPAAPEPADATAAAVAKALAEDRRERERKDEREAAYRREEITFKDFAVINVYGRYISSGIATVPYRGDRRLTVPEFFDAVDRHDLREDFDGRRNFGIGAVVVGSVAALGSMVLLGTKGLADNQYESCPAASLGICEAAREQREQSAEREASQWRTVSVVGLTAGVVVGLVGWYYIARSNPIDTREAYDLADQHNQKLRAKHGLAATTVAPYADASGGGLAVNGRW